MVKFAYLMLAVQIANAQNDWLVWNDDLDQPRSVFIDNGEECLVNVFEQNQEDPNFNGTCNIGGNFIDFYMTAGEIWSFERSMDFGWNGTPADEPSTREKYQYISETRGEIFLWKREWAPPVTNDEWFDLNSRDDPIVSIGIDLEQIDQNLSIQRYIDGDDGRSAQIVEINGGGGTIYEEQTILQQNGFVEETEKYDNGKRTILRMVSDFLWFSLDSWGQEYPESDQVQCTSAGDCLGISSDFTTQKCCAAIAITDQGEDESHLYMYRCLNKGLIGSSFTFKIPQTGVSATGFCDSFSSGAAALAVSITLSTAISTLF